jgi:hypothetical protein
MLLFPEAPGEIVNDTSHGVNYEETNREYAEGIREKQYPSRRQHNKWGHWVPDKDILGFPLRYENFGVVKRCVLGRIYPPAVWQIGKQEKKNYGWMGKNTCLRFSYEW